MERVIGGSHLLAGVIGGKPHHTRQHRKAGKQDDGARQAEDEPALTARHGMHDGGFRLDACGNEIVLGRCDLRCILGARRAPVARILEIAAAQQQGLGLAALDPAGGKLSQACVLSDPAGISAERVRELA